MTYLIKRLFAVIPVLAVVAVIVFLLLRLAPGDPAVIIAGDTASAQDIEHIRQTLGLDRPLLTQFLTWIARVLQGDLGTSVFTGMPVAEMIRQRIEPTLWISALTMGFAVIFAVPMGIVSAWKAGTWIDRTVSALAVTAFSLPVFVIGYGLVYGFSTHLGWFPVQGFKSLSDGFGPFIRHLTLPVISGPVVTPASRPSPTRSFSTAAASFSAKAS